MMKTFLISSKKWFSIKMNFKVLKIILYLLKNGNILFCDDDEIFFIKIIHRIYPIMIKNLP